MMVLIISWTKFLIFILKESLKEIKFLRFYILGGLLILLASYSVYFFLDENSVSHLGMEDHFFEWLTVIFFILASGLFLFSYLKSGNLYYLILSVAMFFAAGEEISWGQRILNFTTPEVINSINVQGEFTLHNIAVFQGTDLETNHKNGLYRLLEINFLFRVFTLFFGIVLPFCVYHFKKIGNFAVKIRLPIPPISLGFLFLFNWLTYKILHTFFLPPDDQLQYVDTAGEIFECIGANILFIISLYFYINRSIIIPGKDIKQLI